MGLSPVESAGLSSLSGVQVKYKASKDLKQEGSSDLPNLLRLEHALNASKLQSNVRQTRLHRLLHVSPASILMCVCVSSGAL